MLAYVHFFRGPLGLGQQLECGETLGSFVTATSRREALAAPLSLLLMMAAMSLADLDDGPGAHAQTVGNGQTESLGMPCRGLSRAIKTALPLFSSVRTSRVAQDRGAPQASDRNALALPMLTRRSRATKRVMCCRVPES